MRNLAWKVVKSVRIGGGRASLVARRYRGRFNGRCYGFRDIRKDPVFYAVIWEGNREEGFPALLSGGWSRNKEGCQELFHVIEERIRALRRSPVSRHVPDLQAWDANNNAVTDLFVRLSDSSLEMKQGKFTLGDLGEAGIVRSK